MNNQPHKWRCVQVPPEFAFCVFHQRKAEVCVAYDHDLRGHLCKEAFEFVRNAEDALAEAHLEQPTDSILDQGIL
jgi:hypothetical protein